MAQDDATPTAERIARAIFGARRPHLEELTGGYQNRLWLVDDPPRRWVLRHLPPPAEQRFRRRPRSLASVEWELHFQSTLHAAGLPVPEPLPTDLGVCAHQDVDGGIWSAASYRPGQRCRPDLAQLDALVDALGDLHAHGRAFAQQHGQRPGMDEYACLPHWLGKADHLGGFASLPELIAGIWHLPAATGPSIGLLHAQRPLLEEAVARLHGFAEDPGLIASGRTVVHADYWELNAAFAGPRLAAIYDLDDSHVDLPVIDAATLLSRSCLCKEGFDWDRARHILRRLDQRQILSPGECTRIVDAILCKECWYLFATIGMTAEEPTVDRNKAINRRLPQIAWHLAHEDEWRRATAG